MTKRMLVLCLLLTTCQSDEPGGPGSPCVHSDQCSDETWCDNGMTCEVPSGAPFDRCRPTNPQCDEAATCMNGGFCLPTCSDNSDCDAFDVGRGAECAEIPDGPSVCVVYCGGGIACPGNAICTDAGGGAMLYCE